MLLDFQDDLKKRGFVEYGLGDARESRPQKGGDKFFREGSRKAFEV